MPLADAMPTACADSSLPPALPDAISCRVEDPCFKSRATNALDRTDARSCATLCSNSAPVPDARCRAIARAMLPPDDRAHARRAAARIYIGAARICIGNCLAFALAECPPAPLPHAPHAHFFRRPPRRRRAPTPSGPRSPGTGPAGANAGSVTSESFTAFTRERQLKLGHAACPGDHGAERRRRSGREVRVGSGHGRPGSPLIM